MPSIPRLRLAIQNRAHLVLYLRLVLILGALFVFVYAGTNWINHRRPAGTLYRLFIDAELRIPFVPGMIFVYHSVQLLLFVAPLLLLEDARLLRLAKAMAAVIVLSGVLFLIFPTALGFPRPAQVAGYEWIYAKLYLLDLPHNLAPSLHVSLSSLTLLACVGQQPRWFGFLLWVWLAALSASVLLVHQHHLLDIATGLALAVPCYYRVYRAPARPMAAAG